MREKIAELEARRAALRNRLAIGGDKEFVCIRTWPAIIGTQIADLRAALTDSGRRSEAAEIVRKLIDRIELSPVVRRVGKPCRSASMAALPTFWRWRQKQKRRSMKATPRLSHKIGCGEKDLNLLTFRL